MVEDFIFHVEFVVGEIDEVKDVDELFYWN
jgi:hypothetical protein